MQKLVKNIANHNSFLIFSVIFTVIYTLLTPDIVIMRSDDYGYYESMIKSLANNRLIIGDWIESYNFFLTFISCLMYKNNSTFYMSTLGVLAFFSFLNFILIYYLLKFYFNNDVAAVLTFAFCTFPVYFNKALDYTGVIPALTFVLSAVIFFKKKNYFLFFLALSISISIRQSAVVLLILPILNFFSFKKDRIVIFLYAVFAGLILFALIRTTPVNYAQKHLTQKVIANFKPRQFFQAFMTGIFAMYLFISISNFLFNETRIKFGKLNILNSIVNNSVLLFHLYLFSGLYIFIETPILCLMTKPILICFAVTCLVIPWIFDNSRIKYTNIYFLVALCFVLLVSIRGIWWDYYFLEVFIFCLIGVFEHHQSKFSQRLNLKRSFYVILFFLFIFNLTYSYLYKIYIDKVKLKTIVYEKLLREKKINIDDISDAPGGFLRWKYFDYYVANEGKVFTGLEGYKQYIKADKTRIVSQLPWRKQPISINSVNEVLLQEGVCSIGYFNQKFAVIQSKYDSNKSILEETPPIRLRNSFKEKIFPLNNSEWKSIFNNWLIQDF